MYKKVLVASMGKYVDEIVEHTLDFLGERETEIIGIYVVETSTPFLTPAKVKKMMIEELTDRGKEVLGTMEEKFKSPHIKFKKLLLEGDPAEEIVKTADQEDVDIIIMGSGKSRIDKHLLGSVSEKVVHSTKSNVLLIKTSAL